MKNIKFLIMTIAMFSFGLSVTSCGSKGAKGSDATEEVDMSGSEYTSAYVCPMHCEGSGSHEAGKCPVCGMDYVANADVKAADGDGHDHDGDDHDGHNH